MAQVAIGATLEPTIRTTRRWQTPALLATLALTGALTALWPGDIPFINDEPHFLYKALRANQRGQLEATGLRGSLGYQYGPLPVWMYQGLLLVSHDVYVVVVLHAILISSSVAAGLIWIARTLRLNPWFIVVVMVSPYTWFYSRALWDSLNLPLSTLAFASYASFLLRPAWWKLLITLACMALMPMVHPMSAALVLPLAAHLAIFRWRDLLRWWGVLMGVVLGGVLLYLPYLNALAYEPGHELALAGASGWWFPLLGGRLLSAAGIDYMFGVNWLDFAHGAGRFALIAAWIISLMSYPLVWLATALGARKAWRLFKNHRTATVFDHVVALAVAIVLAQCVLDGIAHIYHHPHYYGGTWVVYPLLAWVGYELLVKRVQVLRWFLPLQIVALLSITTYLAIAIHHNRGLRTINYGACLAEEVRVVRELNRQGVHGPFAFFNPSGASIADDPFNFGGNKALAAIHTNVNSFLRYPFCLNLIQELIAPGPAAAPSGLWLGITTIEPHPTSVELKVVPIIPPKQQPWQREDSERR
jgi:hypothetical protein